MLKTTRLALRPFTEEDAPEVARLAGDRRVAEGTANIPHPYTEDDARAWIGTHAEGLTRGTLVNCAVTGRKDGTLYGAVGIVVNPAQKHAELGYWLGVPYWNRGYTTEAAAALVRHAFEEMGLLRVYAMYRTGNPASGRVMEKLGMAREGVMREHWKRRFDEGYDDLAFYGLLERDALRSSLPRSPGEASAT